MKKNQKIGPIACFSSSYTSLCTLQPAFQPRSIFDYRIMQIITWTVLTSCVITSIIVPTTSVVLQPDPRIVELLQQAELNPDSAAIVSIEQSILDILLAVGLAWQGMKILCRHVGVHSSNRYGFGVSWSKMHRLGHKIMRLGFSWNACNNIICVEGDGDSDSAAFTVTMQAAAQGFGKQKLHEMKYFSLGGGHLNQLFVAIDDRVPCTYTNMSIDGKISKDKIATKHPAWKNAMDEGLKWTVLHKDLPKTYPSLCNLIQRARNAVSSTHSAESIIELILEIHGLASEIENRGEAPDWDHIEHIVLQSEPPNPEHIQILRKWVYKYGSHSCNFLKDFVYTCVPADRDLNVDVLEAVRAWPVIEGNTFPEVALAIIIAEYNCPVDKVENSVTKFLLKSTIAALPRSSDSMVHAGKLLEAFRLWTAKHEAVITTEQKIAKDGKLYSIVARMLLAEIKGSDTALPGLKGCDLECALCKIANEVINLPQVSLACADGRKIVNPWADWDVDDPKKSDNRTKTSDKIDKQEGQRMVQYKGANATGMQKRTLTSLGFAPGITIEGKSEKKRKRPDGTQKDAEDGTSFR